MTQKKEELVLEIRALAVGAVVEIWSVTRKCWVEARVERNSDHCTKVRPIAHLPDGRKKPSKKIWHYRDLDRIRLVVEPDALARLEGNVFADWLEEHGYSEASLALRKAFPLIEKPAHS